VAGSGQKQFVASLDKNNDRRGQTRKMEQTALRTFFCSFRAFRIQGDSASAAIAVGPVPIDDLNCPGCDPEQVFIQTAVQLEQAFEGHACRWIRTFSDFGSITRSAVEPTQIVLR
jgi:hypothetical protein